MAESLASVRAALERDLTEASQQLAELELLLEDYQAERQHLLRRVRQLRMELDALAHQFVENTLTKPDEA